MKGIHVEIYPILTMTYSPILGTTYELRNVMEVTKNTIPQLEDSIRHLKGGESMTYEASTSITLSNGKT
jgi:hypothetical protein